jgi:uncharacterized protein YkwD
MFNRSSQHVLTTSTTAISAELPTRFVSRSARRLGLLTAAAAAGLLLSAAPTSAEAGPRVAAAEASDALSTINAFRASAGLAPVTLDADLAAGAINHSCYMLQNGIAHDEQPGRPGYTANGDSTGNSSNVAVSSAASMTDREYIELWMSGPFHAIGILRPNLTSVGFGTCVNDQTNPWHSAGTLNVLAGLGADGSHGDAIVWPGDGTTTSLNHFVAESPDPVKLCGWSAGGGLPVIALMPESPTNVSATITGPNGPVPSCALSAQNVSDSVANAILTSDNAVTVVPRDALAPGTYTVTINTSARSVTWSFTVDPNAASATPGAPAAPVPVVDATVLAAPGGFTTIAPVRLVDTRQGRGGNRIDKSMTRRIQVTGNAGVPSGATAISANFTTVMPAADGYVSAFACGATVPTVSTVNFDAASIVANGAIVPLDSTGGICVYTSVAVDVVIDLNGYVDASGTGRLVPTAPRRVLDTRIQNGTATRLTGGQAIEVRLAGGGSSVPAAAKSVVLNVTAVNAAAPTFITAYPCGADRPIVSSVNTAGGQPQSNTAIVALSPAGTVCFFSPSDVDLVVDLSGYMINGPGLRFTPLSATRLVDTRDAQPAMDMNLGGSPMAGTTSQAIAFAGFRGIPSNAVVMSLNVTTTSTTGSGYVSTWPCTADRPVVSSLNAVQGRAVSAAVTGQLSAQGTMCIFVQPTTHVIVDVNGFWSK